jgi:signal transduction histidine kinase
MKVIRQTQSTVGFVKSAAAILAPLFAGAIAAVVSIHIVYSGNLRDSLDAKAESLLIDTSLRLRPSVPTVASDITVVSLTDDDLRSLPTAPGPLRDATLAVYTKVLEALAAANPRFIAFSWLAAAHPAASIDAGPLAAALDRGGLRSRFFLALPFINDSQIPQLLGKVLPLADGDDCIYDVNRICSYPPGWDDWIVKKLVNEFWTDEPRRHISSNLPYLNSYILNFPKARGLRHLSFGEVLAGTPLPADQAYFVGNDVAQDLRFRNAKYVLQRTFTFAESPQYDLQQNGIPFHEFWARLSQMFEAKTTVAVVSAPVEQALVVVFVLGLASVMLRFGVVWAFAILFSNMLILPLANAFALSYALIYLPAFNLFFSGAVLCVVGMMLSVSWSNYQRFRAASVAQHYRDVADIKSNFVSLVSHNLNTTVARLAGLIDIFKNSDLFAAQGAVIRACNASIGELFICVRNVLTNLSMRERKRPQSVLPLRRVVDDFNLNYAAMIRRLAVDYEIEVGTDGPSPGHFVGSVEILHQCMANLLSVSKEFAAEGCLLTLSFAEGSSRLRISSKYFMPRSPAQAVGAFATADAATALGGFARLTLDYINSVVAWTHGSVMPRQSGDNVVIDIELDFQSVVD